MVIRVIEMLIMGTKLIMVIVSIPLEFNLEILTRNIILTQSETEKRV